MSLHQPAFLPCASHTGYPIVAGVLETEAVNLLRSFYERENFHAPDDKRKKKEPIASSQNQPSTINQDLEL